MNIHIFILVWIYVFTYFGYTHCGRIVELCGNSNFWKNYQVVFNNGCTIFYLLSNVSGMLIFLHTCQHLLLSTLYCYSNPSVYEVASHCDFIGISLTNNFEKHFICLLAIYISSLDKSLFQYFALFCLFGIHYFYYWVVIVHFRVCIQVLYQIEDLQMSSIL